MASPLADVLMRGVPDDERSSYPDWLLSAAMHVPERPEMTRALPGYETRDPAELAMLRNRESVRPTAGRADFPMEHLANMASVAAAFSPVGMALAPEMLAGRGLAAAYHAAPKLTGGAGAAAAYLYGSDADAQGSDQVKRIQERLKEKGEYSGPIDGVMKPNGPTERAYKAEQEAERLRIQQEQDATRLRNEGTASEATLETARAAKAKSDADAIESKRLQEEAAARLARKQAGDERIRELDKDLPLSSRIMRDYSGPAGIVAGMIGGSLGRFFTQSKADKAIKETAKAGNAIMSENVVAGKKGADAALARSTRANEFWRKGGAEEVPFLMEPGKAPGFAINPKATKLGDTYSPQIHPAVEAATAAPAALEWGVSNHYKGKWEDELKEAQKALSEDASEANIQRVNAAKDNVGLFTGLERAGQTALAIQAAGAVGSRYLNKGPNMRPNMQPAEQEQGSLQEAIRKAVAAAEKKASKDASAKAPRAMTGPVTIPPGATGVAATRARTLHSL